jgi:aryl-alcohol dehydrogenase-like predicted oxidoreductase
MYGDAERVLGETLRGRRERALVATKVWTADDREADQQIASAFCYFEGRVDVYQVHNLVAWPRRVAQLEPLQAAGSVRVIGVTHYSPGAFGELRRAMEDRRVGAIQVPYNPLERDVESVILPAAADLGLGVIVMRSFGQGRLARRRVAPEALAPLAPFGVSTRRSAERTVQPALAGRVAQRPDQALLKWILSDVRCHVAIPATTSPAHMRTNAAAGEPPWFGPEERAYVARLAHA